MESHEYPLEPSSEAMREMVAQARAAIGEGRPIVVFPQGTRTRPGLPASAAPYLPGVAALYRGTGAPVVPVALNSGLFWPRRSFLRHPGTIVLEYLEPIPPGLERRPFMAELEARIETATAATVHALAKASRARRACRPGVSAPLRSSSASTRPSCASI